LYPLSDPCQLCEWERTPSYIVRDLKAHQDVITTMTKTMAHRGPDVGGVWIGRHVGLGHRRFAIIDLAGGVQPMQVEEERRTTVSLIYTARTCAGKPGAEGGRRRAGFGIALAQKKHDSGWGKRGMRYPASEKLEIIRLVKQSHLPVRRTLENFGDSRATFYRWCDRYQTDTNAVLTYTPSCGSTEGCSVPWRR
jgi:hypothetical protein